MIKNYISVLLLAAISAFSLSELSAQQKKESYKAVVIEKSVDKDGNVTEKKVVKEGDEAKEYINKMNISKGENNIWITDDGEEIDLEGTSHKMIKKQQYKVITKDDDGNEKVVEWDGEGEMPEEIKKALDKANVDVIHDHSNQMEIKVDSDGTSSKSMIKIMKKSNGDSEEVEFEMEGEEIPDDVKEMLKKEGIDINIFEEGESGQKRVVVVTENNDESAPKEEKAQLGVYLESDEGGVKVGEVISGTAADDAGITVGDIITAINDKKVMSVQELIALIGDKKVGDSIKVNYLRGTKNNEVDVTLKAKKEMYKINWDSLNESGNEKEIEIEKKVIIKKEK